MSLKNPLTPPGIDPGTVGLVAQRLNHHATPGPQLVHRTYLFTYLLTPWSRVLLEKLTGSAASREIPRIFGTTHKCPPPVPILSQLHPVTTTPSHFLKIHLNIILPSTSGSPQWSLTLRFHHQNPVNPSPLPHTRYMPRTSHSSQFVHLVGFNIKKLVTMRGHMNVKSPSKDVYYVVHSVACGAL